MIQVLSAEIGTGTKKRTCVGSVRRATAIAMTSVAVLFGLASCTTSFDMSGERITSPGPEWGVVIGSVLVQPEKVASGKVRAQPFSKFGSNGNRVQPLVASTYFGVEKFDLNAPQDFDLRHFDKSSPQILVGTDGAALVETAGCDPVSFGKGDAVVLPACISKFRIQPQPRVEILKSYVPGVAVAEPETSL